MHTYIRALLTSVAMLPSALSCTDTTLRFKIAKTEGGDLLTRDCNYMVANTNRCLFTGGAETCPSACGTCANVVDSPLKLKITKTDGTLTTKGCDWVAVNPDNRCLFDGVAEACRATCDSTTDAPVVPTTDAPVVPTPTAAPTRPPSPAPSPFPTARPSNVPSEAPSDVPSTVPSDMPSDIPSFMPSDIPSKMPSVMPSDIPSFTPSDVPSKLPSFMPSDIPSKLPSFMPSDIPSMNPSDMPSDMPSFMPSDMPSMMPSDAPSLTPSKVPSDAPSGAPSVTPSLTPSKVPSDVPTGDPTFSIKPSPAPSTSTPVATTDAPTDAPVATTDAPVATTDAPVATPATCEDSVIRFKVDYNGDGEYKAQSCTWVANKQTAMRCAVDGVSEICADTCGACATCADSTLRLMIPVDGSLIARYCTWVANKATIQRCGYEGVAEACRSTCGTC